MTVYDIVVPPSANHLWSIFGNRMHKKKAYRDWLEHCSWLIKENGGKIPEGKVCVWVCIVGGTGFMRSRDIDNCIKPCLDLLRESGVLDTDTVARVVLAGAVYREPDNKKSEATCQIRITGLGEVIDKAVSDFCKSQEGA